MASDACTDAQCHFMCHATKGRNVALRMYMYLCTRVVRHLRVLRDDNYGLYNQATQHHDVGLTKNVEQ